MDSRQITRRGFLGSSALLAAPATDPKLVVLTFDDAVKSHRTVVAPLLQEYGFGATFFITHRWMPDQEHFMSWQQVAELHQMGFEIGNHSWTHDSFSVPRNAQRLAGELALIEYELKKVGVPKPVSFAWCGNTFGPEALAAVKSAGYRLARRGINPEANPEPGARNPGPAFLPARHHPLLIPSAAVPDPCWTLADFQKALAAAGSGIPVLQFHGIPDLAHPWVHTPPDRFKTYLRYLKDAGYHVIALRDLIPAIDFEHPPADPLLQSRVPHPPSNCGFLPVERETTQRDLPYWLANMQVHRFNSTEIEEVTGILTTLPAHTRRLPKVKAAPATLPGPHDLKILPYPGGRYPRLGFAEGAIDPLRGTKASVFLPWDPSSYAVVDLPEAIFSNLGLLFLAHTHIPTIWNDQNQVLQNIDWTRGPDGALSSRRQLPNGITFGASITTKGHEVAMELWLRNVTYTNLTGLRTQVCIMLKGAPEFNTQTADNKLFKSPVSAVRSAGGNRWILTAWERCARTWGNPQVPCLHADPVFPDCPPGETVRVKGKMWFFEGPSIDSEIERARSLFATL